MLSLTKEGYQENMWWRLVMQLSNDFSSIIWICSFVTVPIKIPQFLKRYGPCTTSFNKVKFYIGVLPNGMLQKLWMPTWWQPKIISLALLWNSQNTICSEGIRWNWNIFISSNIMVLGPPPGHHWHLEFYLKNILKAFRKIHALVFRDWNG